MHRPLLEKERNNEKDSLVRIAQQCTHSIKMNTNNRREKIQGGILAKGFMDDFRYVQQERIQRMKKVHFGSTTSNWRLI